MNTIYTHEFLFKIVVISFIIYFLLKINSEKFIDTTTSTQFNTDIIKQIYSIYNLDVGIIQTLSQIATSLYNPTDASKISLLIIPGPVKFTKLINTNNIANITISNPNKSSSEALNGIRTNNVVASGSDVGGIGCGPSSNSAEINAKMTNNGSIRCLSFNIKNLLNIVYYGDITVNTGVSCAIIATGTISCANVSVTSNITCANINNSSDYRIKDNVIEVLNNDNFNKLRPVTYFNKINNKNEIGFIAHETQELYPNLVTGEKDGDNNQSVNYIGIIPLLVYEIKKLKSINTELKIKLNNIKKKINI